MSREPMETICLGQIAGKEKTPDLGTDVSTDINRAFGLMASV